MQNVTFAVKDNVLTIKVDLSKDLGRSKSGKTTLVATTGGNVPVPGVPEIKIGINAYKS